MKRIRYTMTGTILLAGIALAAPSVTTTPEFAEQSVPVNEVLEWNQIFIDTLIATNTANSSSQRLGAIVHTAIFDAYNGIERRYTPIFVHDQRAPTARRAGRRSSLRRTRALVGLFPSQQPALDAQLCGFAGGAERRLRGRAATAGRSCATRIERGIAWGTEVAQAVLAWRATDGFSASYPPFTGGTAVGQWRPTPPAFGPMSAQGLAFTDDVRPGQQHPVPAWTTARSDQRHVHGRFQRRQGARSQDRIDAHRGPDGARAVLGGQRQRPLESGSEPDRARQPPVHVRQPTGFSRS